MRLQFPIIRIVADRDIEGIAKLKLEDGDESGLWRNRFGWQYANNPARISEKPLGWVIEAADGTIKGCRMAIPHRFKILNSECYVPFAADTYVHTDIRKQNLGYQIYGAFFSAQKGGLALTSSANEVTEYIMLNKFSAISIGELGISYLYLFNSGRIFQQAFIRRFPKLWFGVPAVLSVGRLGDMVNKMRLPELPDTIECTTVQHDDSCLDDVWLRYRSHYRITVVRDSPYRQWRYGDIPGTKPMMWWVKDTRSGAVAWFSARITPLRKNAEVQKFELLDMFGPIDNPVFQKHTLICAIRQGLNAGVDVLEVKGLHPSWRAHLPSLGFIARKMPCNPFLCKNSGPIDGAVLRQAQTFHITCADGDIAI